MVCLEKAIATASRRHKQELQAVIAEARHFGFSGHNGSKKDRELFEMARLQLGILDGRRLPSADPLPRRASPGLGRRWCELGDNPA